MHQIAFFCSFLNVFDVMRVLRLLTLSRLLALGITGASSVLLSLLQRCSVAVLKTHFVHMSGKAETKIDSMIVKN